MWPTSLVNTLIHFVEIFTQQNCNKKSYGCPWYIHCMIYCKSLLVIGVTHLLLLGNCILVKKCWVGHMDPVMCYDCHSEIGRKNKKITKLNMTIVNSITGHRLPRRLHLLLSTQQVIINMLLVCVYVYVYLCMCVCRVCPCVHACMWAWHSNIHIAENTGGINIGEFSYLDYWNVTLSHLKSKEFIGLHISYSQGYIIIMLWWRHYNIIIM